MINIIKWLLISLFFFIVFCNVLVVSMTKSSMVEDSRALLGSEVGLVFGTSQYLVNGGANPFFENRMDAAAELISSGKVEKLILSGSKDSIYYDEASAMKAALIERNIDPSKFILDKFGNRTLESVARLRDVYGYDQCVMITQEYHAYRCLFIAQELGIDAVAFVAKTPDRKHHYKALARELLARTKAVIDLYILRIYTK